MKDQQQQQQQDSSHSSLEASLDSIGFGAPIRVPNLDVTNLPKPVEFSISKLEPDGGAPSGEYLYNTIAFVVYCEKHNRIALCFNERSEATWLPFIASPQNKTWHDATQDGISIIFSKEDSELDARLTTLMPIQSIFSLHILRIQLPISQKFIYRLIQLVKLGENTDQFKCCQTSKRLHWVNLQDGMNGNVDKLWGPEVVFYSSYVQTLKQQEIFEVGLDQTYAMLPKDGVKHTLEQEMLVSVNITQQVLEKLYSEFLEHCFPSYYMTYTSFQNYMMELLPEYQLKESETMVLQMFHGYDSKRNGYIGFEDYLLGLVAMDPNCINNETRFRLIFRYYDLDQDNMLNADEFRSLLMDLQLSDRSLQQQMVQIIENGIELANFISMCKDGSLKEHINRPCRFAFSPISRICDGFVKRNEQRIIASKRNDNILNQSNKSRGLCLACRDKKYQFGMHCVRLEPSGRCVEPRHLPDYDTESFDEKSDEISVDKYSQDYVFSTVSIGHTFLDMIRDFNTAKGNCQKPNGFLATPDYRDIFIQYLTILCQNVRSLFECEDKLIKINSPAFVIGDIRGNLENLLLMERILWQQVPVVSNNFVFLGNYVNVGKWSIECVLYLFALKIIAPNKFFLIRGFNEVRSSQKAGLQQECLSKYGTKHGTKVWEMVNDVFDRMCLMVVIDEAILCVNSGVPSQTPKLEDLFKMTSTLKDPLLDPIARDILNINRGAEDSILDYMKQNGLSHLIRGNQVLQDGYQLSGNGKILNVFSCSHYCGKKNDLAVICVDHPKIRVVNLFEVKVVTMFLANGCNGCYHGLDDTENEEQFDDDEDEEVPVTDTKELTDSVQDRPDELSEKLVQHILSFGYHWTVLNDQIEFICSLINYDGSWNDHGKKLIIEKDEIISFMIILTNFALKFPEHHSLSKLLGNFFKNLTYASIYWSSNSNPPELEHSLKLDLFADSSAQILKSIETLEETNPILVETIPWLLNSFLLFDILSVKRQLTEEYHCNLMNVIEKVNNLDPDLIQNDETWFAFVEMLGLTIDIEDSIKEKNSYNPEMVKNYVINIIEMAFEDGFVPIEVKPDSNIEHLLQSYYQILAMNALVNFSNHIDISIQQLFAFSEKEISEKLVEILSRFEEPDPCILIDQCTKLFKQSTIVKDLLRFMLPPILLKQNYASEALLKGLRNLTNQPSYKVFQNFIVEILLYIFYKEKGANQQVFEVFEFSSNCLGRSLFPQIYPYRLFFISKCLINYSICPLITKRALSFAYNLDPIVHLDPERTDTILLVQSETFINNDAKWNEFLRDYFSIFLRYCDLCLVRNKMNQIYDQPQMFESFLLLMNLVSEKTVEQYRIKVFGSIRMMFEIDGNQNHKFIIIGFQILADFIKIVSTEYVQSEIVSICLLVFPFLNQFPQEAGKVFNRLFKHTFPKQIYYQLYFIPVVPESTSYEQGSIMAILQSINEIIHKHMGREEIESNSVDMKNLTTIEQFIDYLQSDQFGRKCRNILFVLDHINCGSIPIQEMALTKLLELINQNRELFHQIHSKSLKDCKYLYDDLSWVRLSLFQEGFDGMNQFEKKMYDTLSKIETIADFFRYLIIELSNCAKYATGEQLNLASLCLSAIGAIDPRWMKIKCVTLRVENRLDNRKLLTLPNDPITRIDFTNLKLFRHQNREFKLFLLQTLSNEARHSTQYHIAAAASNAMVKLIKLFEDRRQCRIVDNGDSMVTSSGIIRSDKIESHVNQMAGPTQFRAPNSDVIISQGMNKLDILDELEAVFINERNEPIDRKKHLSRDVSEFITLLENYFFYNLKSISPSLITMEQFFESINPSMSYRTFVSEFIEMLFHCFILDGTSLIPKQRLNVSYQAILSQAYSQMATMNHESCNDRTFSEMLAKLATIQTPIELFYSCYHMLIENLQLAHLLLPSLLIVSLGLGDQESQKRLGEHVRSLINDKLLLNSEYFANELGPMISELLCFLHDVLKEFISNRQLVHNHIIPNLSLRNRAKRFDYEFCGVSIFLDHFQLPEVSRLSYVSHSYYRALFYIEQHYSSLKEKQVSPIVLCHYIQDNLTFLMRIFAGLNDADSINGCSILSRSQFTRLEQQYYQTLARKSNQQLPLCISDKIVKSDIKKIMKGSKPTMEIYENCANYQHILHLLNQDPPKGFQSPLEWYQSIEAYAQPSSESDRLAAQIPSSLTTAPVSPHIVESAKKMNEWDYNESMLNSNGSNLNPIFTSLYSLEAPFMLESKLTEVRNIALTSLRAASFASGPVAYHRAYWNSIVPLHMIYDVYYFAQTLYVQLMESWQTSSSISSMSPDQTVDSVETMFQEMLQQFKLRNSILPSISNSLDMNEDVIQRVLDVQRSLVSIVRHHHLKRQSINADGVPSRPPLSNVLLTIETFRFWIHSLRAALNCGQLDRAYSHMLAAYQLYYEQRDQHNNAFQLDDDEILDFTLNAARVFWYKNDSNSAIKLLKSEIDRKYSDIHRHCCLETARLYDKPTNARDFVEVINTLQLNSSMNCMNFESTRPFVSSRACLMDNSFKLESVSQANLDRYGKIELVYSDYCNHSKQLPMNSLMVLYRAAVIARPKWEKGHYKLAIFLFNMIQEFEINSKTIGVDTSINFVKLEDIIELKNQVIKVLVESLKHDTKRVSVSLKYILDIWTQMGSEYHTIATTSKLPKVYRHFEYTPVQINRVKDLYHRYLGLINTNIVQLTKSCSLAIFLMEVDTLIAHILHPCELVSINVRDILSTLLAEYPHHMSWKFTRCLRATNRRGMISKLIHTTAIKKPSTFFNLQKYYTDFQSFTSLLSDIARYKHRARNRQSSSSSTNPLDSNKFAIRQVCPKLIRILENLGEHRFIMPCNDILLPTLTTVERASTKENFNHFFRGHFIEKVDEYGCSMKSLQAPKRITFLCHDGINRTVLCKAVDDLRKDQLMMNFSNLLNQCYRGEVPDVGTLHESEKHEDELRTRARRKQNRLHIRTYTVCAISDEFGVIEWVHGLQSYKTIVEPLYNKTRAGKKRYQFARLNYIKNASQNDSFRRLENFRKALPNFLPAVFQNWFVNHFADSYSWWNARCNFTWSTAAYSIVGYMLGLGDRHTENLLIDPSNGEMVQVDFNCLFNKGEEFVVPECVPFRLTHNMVSAMGLLGVDGQFRHTAEDVCLLLRQYRSLFVRFTKILIHDPLEEWTSSGECAEKAEKALLGVEARLAGFCSHDARGIPKGTKIYADQQVDMLIKEATSFENIGLMYHGWAPYL